MKIVITFLESVLQHVMGEEFVKQTVLVLEFPSRKNKYQFFLKQLL